MNYFALAVSGTPMTGMLDTNSPDNGDAPAMEVAGNENATDPTATDWTAGQVPLPDQETDQMQQAPGVEQYQLYSKEQLKSAAQNIEQADPIPANSGEVVEQPPESNGQHTDQSTEKPAGEGDSESPSNMELEDAPKEEAEEATDAAVEQEPVLPSEYERLSKVVEDNPEDFNGWVYLLQYVEQEVSALTS